MLIYFVGLFSVCGFLVCGYLLRLACVCFDCCESVVLFCDFCTLVGFGVWVRIVGFGVWCFVFGFVFCGLRCFGGVFSLLSCILISLFVFCYFAFV